MRVISFPFISSEAYVRRSSLSLFRGMRPFHLHTNSSHFSSDPVESSPCRGEKETLSVHLNADTDGLYYYCVGSCQVNVTNVRLNTILTTYNPHGFLSAASYGELPFSLFLLVLSSVLLAYWVYRMVVTSTSSSFHHRIAVQSPRASHLQFCLFVSVLRSLSTTITCFLLNRHGSVGAKTRCLAAFIRSLSQGLLLEVLFHVLWQFLSCCFMTHSYDALRDVAGATNTTWFAVGYAVLETVFHLESGNARKAARVSDAM